MNTPRIGRFAPSPSGPLHLGSLLAAVVSWLDARAQQGQWLVRIEDLDPPREQPGASDLILHALEQHGLHWDGPVRYQSQRSDAYQAALDQLADQGLLFRCTCTRRQLRAAGGVYPGTCRAQGMAPLPGNPPHTVRLRVPDPEQAERQIHDRLQGPFRQNLATDVGDFNLVRKDRLWAYQLAVVVDDADQGITDIVRGVDLLDSSPRQHYLQERLGYPHPAYLHLPVLIDAEGSKLSKQTGAPPLNLQQPRTNLARVLAWLKLPHDRSAPCADQLHQALASYRAEQLPRNAIQLSPGP